MELYSLILTFIKFFLPPRSSDVEEKQLAWRNKVASTLAIIVIVIVCGSLLAVGRFPSVTKGFAMVEDEDQKRSEVLKQVSKVQQDLAQMRAAFEDIRQDQLDTRLYDIRGRQCAAMLMKNEEALRSEGERLKDDLPKYRGLTGTDWRIPPCNEY